MSQENVAQNGGETLAREELSEEDLIECVRAQCMKNKVGGSIMGLSTVFRKIDRDHSKRLNYREFTEGMRSFGINLNDKDMKRLFETFDADKTKTVDFNEFLKVLKPPMPDCRKKLVSYVFDLLDKDSNGVLTTDDIAKNGNLSSSLKKNSPLIKFIFFYLPTSYRLVRINEDHVS